MTKRSYTRRLGKEWGRKAYATAHAPKGERINAQRKLRAYVTDKLRAELRRAA